jgi:hypothetical protein
MALRTLAGEVSGLGALALSTPFGLLLPRERFGSRVAASDAGRLRSRPPDASTSLGPLCANPDFRTDPPSCNP